jgi:hypothetical protein
VVLAILYKLLTQMYEGQLNEKFL